jgi:hypothetical protein
VEGKGEIPLPDPIGRLHKKIHMKKEIQAYKNKQSTVDKEICELLATTITVN